MEFALGFHKKTMTLEVDQDNLMGVLKPNKINELLPV